MPFMTYIPLRAMPLSNGMRIWREGWNPLGPKLLGFILIFIRTDVGCINSFFEEVKQGKAHHFRREVRVKSGDGWKWICANTPVTLKA